MNRLNRRGFLQLAGTASVAVPVAFALDVTALSAASVRDLPAAEVYRFRAVAGMPQRPLPAYASYVLEGHVDLGAGTGIVAQTVFAGAPEAMSDIALPGLSRTMRMTEVHQDSDGLRLLGVIDNRSQLRRGESANVQIRIDRASGMVSASFYGSETELSLAG
jgi:hypothetical protein